MYNFFAIQLLFFPGSVRVPGLEKPGNPGPWDGGPPWEDGGPPGGGGWDQPLPNGGPQQDIPQKPEAPRKSTRKVSVTSS